LQASQRNGDLSPLSSPSSSPGGGASTAVAGPPPRSQAINVEAAQAAGGGRTPATGAAGDINSLSPPSVQFCVGTPPTVFGVAGLVRLSLSLLPLLFSYFYYLIPVVFRSFFLKMGSMVGFLLDLV